MRNKVPPGGIVYGEQKEVPKGSGSEYNNPRLLFLKSHSDPRKYAYFGSYDRYTDGDKYNNRVESTEAYRLYPLKQTYTDFEKREVKYLFGSVTISDSDKLFVREITYLPLDKDQRYQFFSNPENKGKVFFDYNGKSLGEHMNTDLSQETGNTYYFENGEADSEEKIYYEDSVSGGRRKRRTNRRKNKNRRTKSRRNRRS
jgi:hypothetical protein